MRRASRACGGLCLLLAGALLAVCQLPRAQGSLYSVLSTRNDTTTLKAAIDAAGLNGTLSNATLTWTVFAPTDAAFAAAFAALQVTPQQVLARGAALQPLLLYHVLPGVLNASAINGTRTSYTTLGGGDISVIAANGVATVSGLGSSANVTAPNIPANGSVVHVVNQLLLPFYVSLGAAVSGLNFTTLGAAVNAANLGGVLGNVNNTYTLFAPTDAAFTSTLNSLNITAAALLNNTGLLTRILQYHIVPVARSASSIPTTPTSVLTLLGGRLSVERGANDSVTITPVSNISASVVRADVPVGLGPLSYVHAINSVLLPVYPTVAAALRGNNITTLSDAITAEGTYASVLTGNAFTGTIFAPTDRAFEALLTSLNLTATQLLSNTALVKAVLDTHIVPNRVFVAGTDFTNGQSLATISNQTLTINNVNANTVSSNRTTANMTLPGLEVGVDRVSIIPVNAVLLPANLSLPSTPSPAPQPPSSSGSLYSVIASNPDLTTLKAALDAANLNGTLGNPLSAYTVFAPSDTAFTAALGALGLTPAELLNNPALSSLLLYHVVPGAIAAANISQGNTTLATLDSNRTITVNRNGNAVTISSLGTVANVVTADLASQSGYVHIIDAPLLPFYLSLVDAVTKLPNESALRAAIATAGLNGTLSQTNLNYTLFAPTDAGFAATLAMFNQTLQDAISNLNLLQAVLAYHIIPSRVLSTDFLLTPRTYTTLGGTPLTVSRDANGNVTVTPISGYNVTVQAADIPVGLGPMSVVHQVSGALLPFYPTISAALAARGITILAQAIASDDAYASALTQPFNGTLLAPTDRAFEDALPRLGLTNATQLLANRTLLRQVLQAHIIPGQAYLAQDLANVTTLRTVGNDPLTVDTTSQPNTTIIRTGSSAASVIPPALPVNGNVASVLPLDSVLLPSSVTNTSAPPPPPAPLPAPAAIPSPSPSPGVAAIAAPSALLVLWSVLAAGLLLAFRS